MMPSTVANPFFFSAYASPHYFCDRAEETRRLIDHARNARHVVLCAPRRLGKTGLIQHLFRQPEIEKNFYCVYCDVFPTSTLPMFLYRLSSAILQQTKKHSLRERLLQVVRSIRFSIAIDPQTGTPCFGLNLGSVENPPQALSEIFCFLNSLDRPVILAIDEFQQIGTYRDSTVEAQLRSVIQFSPNVRLIYSGSEQHMLVQMFSGARRPFFQSAVYEGLKPIDRSVYACFAQNLFAESNKSLPLDVFHLAYDSVSGITYYVQYLLNLLFASTAPAAAATSADFDAAMSAALSQGAIAYTSTLHQLSQNQQALLFAVAQEKQAAEIQSMDFIRRHELASPSSMQSAARALMKDGLLEKTPQGFRVYDPLFAEWLRRDSRQTQA